jgi:hypothetical protein
MHRVQLFPVRCTVSQSPCGARCANPRAVHGVPIPVRLLTVTDLPERDSFHLPRVVPALATLTDEDGIALLIDPEEGVTERTRAGAYASGGASWGMYMAEEG